MIILENIEKTFHDGDKNLEILKNVSIQIETGKKVAIIGPSGSGKTTLLSIISGLDKPTSGRVIIDDVDIHTLSENDMSVFRNKKISIIFQSFELIQFFTAYENAMLPLSIRNSKNTKEVDDVLEKVGLTHRKHNMPSTLSGGEQQRVAIARAILAGSDIIFADEPTGNLDTKTSIEIMGLLHEIHSQGNTIIIVTHEEDIALHAHRIIRLRDGIIEKDSVNEDIRVYQKA
jgi:putative ABC transport system ATP-binding protein